MLTAAARSQDGPTLAVRDRATLVLGLLDDLPIPSFVRSRLLVRAGEEISVDRLVDAIEQSEDLFAGLQRLSRKLEPDAATDARSADELIAALGIDAVREAVLSMQFLSAFEPKEELPEQRSLRCSLWRHSVDVASVCRLLCQHATQLGEPAAAFDSGLLHDVGKLALAACCPKSYRRVMDRVREERRGYCCVERDSFGIDHTVAGRHLAIAWQLSPEVFESIRNHHEPFDLNPGPDVGSTSAVVYVGDQLALRAAIGETAPQPVRPLEELANVLGVPQADLASVAEGLAERRHFYDAMLSQEGEPTKRRPRRLAKARLLRPGRDADTGCETVRRMLTDTASVSAIRTFLETLSLDGWPTGMHEVCLAAARSVQAAWSSGPVGAFIGSSNSEVYALGCADPDAAVDPPCGMVLPVSDAAREVRSALADRAPLGRGAVGFGRAVDGCQQIWERCVGTVPRDRLWMLPISASADDGRGTRAEVWGGVLLESSEQAAGLLESDASGFDVLAGVIGLAASRAISRIGYEREFEQSVDHHLRSRDAESRRADERLISKVAAMAAGAAHEINNPLSVISGRAQMLLARCEDDDSAKSLGEIRDQAHLASQIVVELMGFAKPESPRPRTIRVVELIEPLLQHWQGLPGVETGHIDLAAVDGSIAVYADPDQVREILDAVVRNALEATNSRTRRVHINSRFHASDEAVRIVVEDNGVGMSCDVLEHAFDPFFSHRPAGRSRGLGLSRAYRLAEINQGSLRLESEAGSGTTVTLELPSHPADA